jgi:serine/threonine-protein kinase
MTSLLLTTTRTDLDAETFLTLGSATPPLLIRKESEESRAWFVFAEGRPCFAKWVEAARYESRLAKDAAICAVQLHPAIVRLLNRIETADGMLLLFERVAGENLGESADRRRFFALPLAKKLTALRAIFQALAAIVAQGWILVDFYDGNVLYDFATDSVNLFDFELFERGNGFALQLDRNYGSSRLMAPEEFVRGAWIDEASNVFTLGRYAIGALSRRMEAAWQTEFEGSAALAEVLARATHENRSERYPTVQAFVNAFDQANEI